MILKTNATTKGARRLLPSTGWKRKSRPCAVSMKSSATKRKARRSGSQFLFGMLPASGSTFRTRSEEHTSELQSHSDLHSFPTRRSSDLLCSEHEKLSYKKKSQEKWFSIFVWDVAGFRFYVSD